MHRFNGVGGIDAPTDISRILEVDRQILTLAAPELDDDRVLIAPAAIQLI